MAAAATASRDDPAAGTVATTMAGRAMVDPGVPAVGTAAIATMTVRAARVRAAVAATAQVAPPQSPPIPNALDDPDVRIGERRVPAPFRRATPARCARVRSGRCPQSNQVPCARGRGPVPRFGAPRAANGLRHRPCQCARRGPSVQRRPRVRRPRRSRRHRSAVPLHPNRARREPSDRAAAIARTTPAPINDRSGKHPVRRQGSDPLPPGRPSRLQKPPSRRPDRR